MLLEGKLHGSEEFKKARHNANFGSDRLHFLPLDLPRTLASCPRVAADTNRLHWPNAMSYAALDAIVARHGAVRATFKRAQIKRRTLSFAFPILLKLLGRMLYQRSMR